MTTTLCLLATLLAILTIPVLVLLWITETRQQRARRWRADGMSQQAIADRLGVSRSTVRRMLAA
jgi:DNA invertase Pin-like site-specific DNA recombinase